MSITATDLYEDGPAAGAKAKILLIHFDGAIDAGAAGRIAIGQMLRSLHNERVATFDADTLMDYRSHRPIVTVDDWVSSPDMVMPKTVLDLVEDDMGNPILVLHGAEPDAHWESFTNAINDICKRAGVEITFSLHGVPSGVPHTRPTPVHVQATDASLLPAGGAKITNHMQFPAPLSTFVQIRLGQRGIGGLALLGAVPYYMADTGYPAASSALLTSLAKFADLSLPVGDLEQGAAQDQENIEKLVESNPDISHTVSNLEEHFDAWSGGDGAIPLAGMAQPAAARDEDKSTKDIGDVIEAYRAPKPKKSSPSSAHPASTAPRLPPSPTPSKTCSPASRPAATAKNPGPPRRATAPKRRTPPALLAVRPRGHAGNPAPAARAGERRVGLVSETGDSQSERP